MSHLLAIMLCQCTECEPLPYGLFVLGMEIFWVSRVDRNRQARVGNAGGCDCLRLPRFCPRVIDGCRTPLSEGWQADNVEREVALCEELSPIGDRHRKDSAVLESSLR